MTERIDHVAEARMHIDWAHEQQAREGVTERTVTGTALLAQVHATLALVEQQRIANMQLERSMLWTRSGRRAGQEAERATTEAGVLDAQIRRGLGPWEPLPVGGETDGE